MNKNTKFVALLFLTALIACSFYIPGLTGGFIFDDYQAVVENSSIKLDHITWDGLVVAAHAYGGPIGRPVATLSFAVGYWLHGMSTFSFKLENVVIHLLNVMLVGLLVRSIIRLAWPEESERGQSVAAILVALVWGLHPLQVSAVLYVVQRMELLGNLFLLISLNFYVVSRLRWIQGQDYGKFMVLALVSLMLGLLSKENSIQAPLYTLVMELVFFGFKGKNGRSLSLQIVYLSAFLAGGGLFFGLVLPRIAYQFDMRDFTMLERVLTQFRVLPTYLTWMVWPSPENLSFYHDDFAPSRGLFHPLSTIAGGVALGSLLIGAVYWRSRAPLVSLAIGFFFASHAITSAPLALELVFEHRNYLAILSPVLITASLVRLLIRKKQTVLGWSLVTGCVLMLMFTTLLRSATWGDRVLLATTSAIDNKRSPRASYELASIYMERAGEGANSANYNFAMAELKRAMDLPRSSPLPEQALILIAINGDQQPEERWTQSIIKKFESRPLGPQEFSAYYSLISDRMKGIKVSDKLIIRLSELYTRRQPDLLDAHLLYADYAGRILHNYSVSAREYCYAIKIKKDPDYGTRLISSLVEQDRLGEAKLLAPCVVGNGNAK
ncbi:hypothetical protein [Xanthomonas campestris]|uniref:hypothetical protein n=1 Tax=Xanthomonas campestris TaxID=339 RepID=UPI0005AEFEEF|nr:hypothetical protein [Xanthomonas campestris]KIQ29945.1 hypothetical protein RT95_01500 [Xanthomonas campestris]